MKWFEYALAVVACVLLACAQPLAASQIDLCASNQLGVSVGANDISFTSKGVTSTYSLVGAVATPYYVKADECGSAYHFWFSFVKLVGVDSVKIVFTSGTSIKNWGYGVSYGDAFSFDYSDIVLQKNVTTNETLFTVTQSGNEVNVSGLSVYSDGDVIVLDPTISGLPYSLTTSNAAYNLTANLTSAGNGIVFASGVENVSIDCLGHNLTGVNTSIGVTLQNNKNVTITNCSILNFQYGLKAFNGSELRLTNNTVVSQTALGVASTSNAVYALWLNASNSTFYDNVFKSTSGAGADGNIGASGYASNTSTAVTVLSSLNYFARNTITATSGTGGAGGGWSGGGGVGGDGAPSGIAYGLLLTASNNSFTNNTFTVKSGVGGLGGTGGGVGNPPGNGSYSGATACVYSNASNEVINYSVCSSTTGKGGDGGWQQSGWGKGGKAGASGKAIAYDFEGAFTAIQTHFLQGGAYSGNGGTGGSSATQGQGGDSGNVNGFYFLSMPTQLSVVYPTINETISGLVGAGSPSGVLGVNKSVYSTGTTGNKLVSPSLNLSAFGWGDVNSNLTVSWNVSVKVFDNASNLIGGANVNVKNNFSSTDFSGVTNFLGKILGVLNQYLVNSSSFLNYAPHNFTASAIGCVGNSTVANVSSESNIVVTMSCSNNLTVSIVSPSNSSYVLNPYGNYSFDSSVYASANCSSYLDDVFLESSVLSKLVVKSVYLSPLTFGSHYFTANCFNGSISVIKIVYFYFDSRVVLNVYCFDEATGNNITCDSVTVSNSTNSTIQTNAHSFTFSYPTGNVLVTAANASFYSRTYSTYFLNSNVSVNAFLLNASLTAIFVRFHVSNSFSQPVSNASILLQRFINGSNVVVSSLVTDSFGLASDYLELNHPYTVLVYATGFNVYVSTISPVVNDYYITLVSTTNASIPVYDTYNLSNTFGDAYWNLEPNTHSLSNETTNIVFSVFSPSATLHYFGMRVDYANGTNICFENVTNSSAGGVVSCLVFMDNSTLGDNVSVTVWISRSPVWVSDFIFWFKKTASTSVNTLSDFYNDMSAAAAGSDKTAMAFIVIVVATIAGLFVYQYHKTGALLVMLGILWLGAVEQFLDVNLIGVNVNGVYLMALITVAVVSINFLKERV